MEPIEIASAIANSIKNAWNKSSGEEFQKSFTNITDFIDVTGTHHKAASKEAIGAGHQGIFNSIYKDSVVDYTVAQAIKIDANTILAHIYGVLEVPGGPLAGTHNSRITVILIPENNEWKIRAFQNTLVRDRG